MTQSNKAILAHIPDFIDYCNQQGLSAATQRNYLHYLNKFSGWLTAADLEGLLPHQLTANHISDYKLHLSTPHNLKNSQALQKSSQKYYLIALRALLGYFTAKDIVSLIPAKIGLPKADKSLKNQVFPSLNQLDSVFILNQKDDAIRLRNKAILHTIISTGFKISQITGLNKNSADSLPEETKPHIKKYLETRNDNEDALFINYSGMKNASRRLTQRMVQRIIKQYGTDAGLPATITPETLRFANILAVWNKEIEIKNISWQEVERTINQNILALKENISILTAGYKSQTPLSNIIKCDDCILRKIATLMAARIVSYEKIPVQKLWPGFSFNSNAESASRQGKHWHRHTIDSVAQYMKAVGNNITFEPPLNYGRADISITKNNTITHIEIGTVSLFKIWYNLMVMPSVVFILVPNEEYIIKFKKL